MRIDQLPPVGRRDRYCIRQHKEVLPHPVKAHFQGEIGIKLIVKRHPVFRAIIVYYTFAFRITGCIGNVGQLPGQIICIGVYVFGSEVVK
ncbi:hypothetical protein ES705_45990 [subsurface metagenome]